MTRRTPKAHAAMTSAAMGLPPADMVNTFGSAVSLVVANSHAPTTQIFDCQATFGVALSRLLRTMHKQGHSLAEALLHDQPSGSLPLRIQNIVSHALERAAMPMSAGMHYGTSTTMVQR